MVISQYLFIISVNIDQQPSDEKTAKVTELEDVGMCRVDVITKIAVCEFFLDIFFYFSINYLSYSNKNIFCSRAFNSWPISLILWVLMFVKSQKFVTEESESRVTSYLCLSRINSIETLLLNFTPNLYKVELQPLTSIEDKFIFIWSYLYYFLNNTHTFGIQA